MNTKRKTPAISQLLLVTVMLLLTAGCGKTEVMPSVLDDGGASPVVFTTSRPGETVPASEQRSYTLAASIYAGWMPWYFADETGVLAKWAEREGIEIDVVSMDYVTSIEAFVTGRADACLITNMDVLGLPVAAGIDTTVLVIGDYSNGNDKILTRGIDSVVGLRGEEVSLVELSVSDYLLSRALEQSGLSERDVRLVNTGDSKIGAEFLADKQRRAVVTWNPIASRLASEPGIRSIYDSAQIPGEILDLCVVKTETLQRDPRLGRALVGAWYEVLALMRDPDARGQAALAKMAELADCSVAEFQSQLETTFMFWDPAAAVNYARSPALRKNMQPVRQFCFAKKLLGEDVRSVDDVGIAYPDGTVQGDPNRVRLRFDTSFAQAAE